MMVKVVAVTFEAVVGVAVLAGLHRHRSPLPESPDGSPGCGGWSADVQGGTSVARVPGPGNRRWSSRRPALSRTR